MTPDERTRAACRGKPTGVFYPVDPDGGGAAWDQARAICAACPVKAACERDHSRERFGMWFGTTPAERGFGRDGRPPHHITIGRPTPVRDRVLTALTATEPRSSTEVRQLVGGAETAVRAALRWHVEHGNAVVVPAPHPRPDRFLLAGTEEEGAA